MLGTCGRELIAKPSRRIPAGDWLRAQRLARAIVMQRQPGRQRRLVELVYAPPRATKPSPPPLTPSDDLGQSGLTQRRDDRPGGCVCSGPARRIVLAGRK